MKTVVGVLCLLLVVKSAVAQSITGTCTAEQQMTYVAQELPTSCGLNLGVVNSNDSSIDRDSLDAALNVTCTEDCGGALANWLLRECSDRPGAEGLYYWCLGTGSTALFSRCRYATPPHFNAMSSIGGAAPCFAANETNPCPIGCDQALMGLALIGCCYQSLYNNTAYLQGLLSSGSLTQEGFGALQALSDPLLWGACQVTPPAMICTDEGIEFPRSGATFIHSSWAVASILITMSYVLF